MCHTEESYRPAVTVNSLPDNVFREIFAFCLSNIPYDHWHMAEWQRLVQVCQRWQQIIYGSPRYLDLHLHCSHETPFRPLAFWKNPSRWPEFPLTLHYTVCWDGEGGFFDLIDALEQPDRVHRINLTLVTSIWSSDSKVDEVLEEMRVPFPALTHLDLTGPVPDPNNGLGIFLPDDFLGESAPCLQHIFFQEICFQELPKFLLSARGLVSFQLEDISPDAGYGYISPEALAGLAGLTRLKTLSIKFRFPQDPPYSNKELEKGRCPEPQMRGVLPALTEFVFSGESKYLEDLVARIDMPSVEDIKITYFPPESPVSPVFEVRQLSQFVGRTANLELAPFRRAQVTFDGLYSQVKFDRPQGECHQIRFSLDLQISEAGSDSELDGPDLDVLVPCTARVLCQFTALLSNVGHLSFDSLPEEFIPLDNSELLPLLLLFPTVEELHVSGALAEHIATVLENITEERVTEVMPALHSLWLGNGDKPVGSIERFLSLRRLSGRPVTIGNPQDEVVG